ncbi:hypothetical protein V2J09_019858 [Rumex salicifolius]
MAYQSITVQGGSGSSSSSGFHYLNSPFGDTTFTKVFVGGLAWETQSDTLRRYFDQFGDILEAVVITDKNSGRSKGYGFVTFRDPEAARRACADPTPVIDGRRANCNLASVGRPRQALTYGRMRFPGPVIGHTHASVGGLGYQQSIPYGYQQGYIYSPYGYPQYGPEYSYTQGPYNPYLSQQYLQLYGVPGSGSTALYPYGQMGQSIPSNDSYPAFQGYALPGHQIVQFSGPGVTSMTSPIPSIQQSYHAGAISPVPARVQFVVPAHSQQFMQAGLRIAVLLLEWRASDLALQVNVVYRRSFLRISWFSSVDVAGRANS